MTISVGLNHISPFFFWGVVLFGYTQTTTFLEASGLCLEALGGGKNMAPRLP